LSNEISKKVKPIETQNATLVKKIPKLEINYLMRMEKI